MNKLPIFKNYLKSLKVVVTEENEDQMETLMKDNRIIKKELSNGVVSFNFSRDVFYGKDWDEMTTKARGLFYNKNLKKIVARSYDKFFNIGEMEAFEETLKKLKYPVSVFHKYNGFLGILGFNPENDNGLFVASKSTNASDFSEYFNSILKKKILGKEKQLTDYLSKNNVSLVFEVIDPDNDPHIVKYKSKDLVLLDIIKNTASYQKLTMTSVISVAKSFGFKHKQLVATLGSESQLMDFYNEIEKEDFLLDGQPVEGFVFEDSNSFMIKFKTGFYNFWKRMRGLADLVASFKNKLDIKIKPFFEDKTLERIEKDFEKLKTKFNETQKSVGMKKGQETKEEKDFKSYFKKVSERMSDIEKIKSKNTNPTAMKFMNWVFPKSIEELKSKSIIELREEFGN